MSCDGQEDAGSDPQHTNERRQRNATRLDDKRVTVVTPADSVGKLSILEHSERDIDESARGPWSLKVLNLRAVVKGKGSRAHLYSFLTNSLAPPLPFPVPFPPAPPD